MSADAHLDIETNKRILRISIGDFRLNVEIKKRDRICAIFLRRDTAASQAPGRSGGGTYRATRARYRAAPTGVDFHVEYAYVGGDSGRKRAAAASTLAPPPPDGRSHAMMR